jgi:hypothetical protein
MAKCCKGLANILILPYEEGQNTDFDYLFFLKETLLMIFDWSESQAEQIIMIWKDRKTSTQIYEDSLDNCMALSQMLSQNQIPHTVTNKNAK